MILNVVARSGLWLLLAGLLVLGLGLDAPVPQRSYPFHECVNAKEC